MNGKYKDGQLESFNDIKIINPENTDISFTSFAGKNGNHDIQGMYSNFFAIMLLELIIMIILSSYFTILI